MTTATSTIESTFGSSLRASGVDDGATQRDAESHDSIAAGAMQALVRHLLQDPSLDIPQEVSENASAVRFTPDANPFMPTPMKMTESVSALWSCIGLFASTICQQRYNTSKPDSIEVDVHSATLMLMSLALFEIPGLEEGEAARRVQHIEKGRIYETYRAMATNMYEVFNLL